MKFARLGPREHLNRHTLTVLAIGRPASVTGRQGTAERTLANPEWSPERFANFRSPYNLTPTIPVGSFRAPNHGGTDPSRTPPGPHGQGRFYFDARESVGQRAARLLRRSRGGWRARHARTISSTPASAPTAEEGVCCTRSGSYGGEAHPHGAIQKRLEGHSPSPHEAVGPMFPRFDSRHEWHVRGRSEAGLLGRIQISRLTLEHRLETCIR